MQSTKLYVRMTEVLQVKSFKRKLSGKAVQVTRVVRARSANLLKGNLPENSASDARSASQMFCKKPCPKTERVMRVVRAKSFEWKLD